MQDLRTEGEEGVRKLLQWPRQEMMVAWTGTVMEKERSGRIQDILWR